MLFKKTSNQKFLHLELSWSAYVVNFPKNRYHYTCESSSSSTSSLLGLLASRCSIVLEALILSTLGSSLIRLMSIFYSLFRLLTNSLPLCILQISPMVSLLFVLISTIYFRHPWFLFVTIEVVKNNEAPTETMFYQTLNSCLHQWDNTVVK